MSTTITRAAGSVNLALSSEDILAKGLLSVWAVTESHFADVNGKRCVFIRSEQDEQGTLLKFHVPGTDYLTTLCPYNLQKIVDDASFPYDGDYYQKFSWLFKNPLNGVAYGTGFRYAGLIEDQFELQLLNPSEDESVGAAGGQLEKKRTLDEPDVSAARPLKTRRPLDKFSRGDKVRVTATSELNAQEYGKSGEVLSQVRVSQDTVNAARALYPPDVVDAILAKRYYNVCLPEYDITISGDDLELIDPAPVAGGAPGAP